MSARSAPQSANVLEPKLSPEEYHDMLQGLELQTVALDALRASVNRDALATGEPVPVELESKSHYSQDTAFRVQAHLKARCRRRGRLCLLVDASYTLMFSSAQAITPEFFEVFEHLNLPIWVWPFFRELVHSMTYRMGLPPLTLPLNMVQVGPRLPSR